MTNYPNNLDDASSIPIATSGGGSGSVPDATSTVKGILKLTNDLGGSANLPKVTGLQSYDIEDVAPTDSQILTWIGLDSHWSPVSIADLLPDADGSTKGILPLSNDLGGTVMFPRVVGIQGRAIENVEPLDNQILTWVSLDSHWTPVSIADLLPDADGSTKGVLPLSNDLGGTVNFPRVVGIQGRAIQNVEPPDGYVLTWDSMNAYWYPAEASATPPDATDLVKGIVQLANDLSGTADAPTVVGIGNTPIVGTFQGGFAIVYNDSQTEWSPAFVDGYSDLTISAGIESLIGTGSNTFTSIGSIQINANDFGASSIFIFEAVFQATTGETAELKLYNITEGLDVSGSLLTTTSNSFEYQSAIVTLTGDKLYEAQFRIDNGSPSPTDGVISGNVKIRVKHRDF